jgi:hypothetical protein
MIKFEFDDKGLRKLSESLEKFAKDVEKETIDAARRAAAGSRCPEHHKMPKVTVSNTRTGEFTITACCDKGVKAANDAVARTPRE